MRDWTPSHVAISFEDFALKDDMSLRRLRCVCGSIAVDKRAVLRDSMEGYNGLYLSLMPGSNALYRDHRVNARVGSMHDFLTFSTPQNKAVQLRTKAIIIGKVSKVIY